MQEAQKDKATDEHNVIDDAIAEKGEGYTVFSIVSAAISQSPLQALTKDGSLWECYIDPRRRN